MYIDKIDCWKIPVGLKLASLFAEILFDLLCFDSYLKYVGFKGVVQNRA